MGTLHHEGVLAGGPKAATEWFRRSAEQGYAPAQFNLGNAYRRGDGVRQNDAAASEWWKRAADQEFAPAQYNLATQYLFGRGLPRDESIALIYYRRSAENGHPGAAEAWRRLEALEGARAAGGEPVPGAEQGPARGPAAEAGGTAATPGSARMREGPTMAAGARARAGSRWIGAQDPRWFTVQIASLGSEERARAFIAGRAWEHPVGYVPVERGEKRRYSVLYGAFPDRAAARHAAQTLSRSARTVKEPWIRAFASVQAELSR